MGYQWVREEVALSVCGCTLFLAQAHLSPQLPPLFVPPPLPLLLLASWNTFRQVAGTTLWTLQ